MTDPTKLFENAAAQYSPTDLQKTMRAAGIDPNSEEGQKILRSNIDKTNRIAPVALRPGGAYLDGNGKLQSTPAAAPAGFENVPLADGSWRTVPVQGGTEAITASTAAHARGSAGYQLTDAYDPSANGGKGGMVRQTVANAADAANGNAPAPLRNNNPGALMPGGKLAQYPDVQTGLAALDNNLQSYGKQGINTISGVISKWAPPNENDTQGYIKDVSQRLGIPPNQKIDLSNPLHRQALSTAITLHENGPSGVFGSQQQAPARQSGAFAAAPPMGAQANANESQKAGGESMATSYKGLQASRAGGSSALQDIDHMLTLGSNKSPAVAGPYMESVAKIFSPNAAEYEKSRDNLVTQLSGQLGMSTDAARSMVYGSIPGYGAPKDAIKNGLTTLKNQVQARMLKADLLTPMFNSGDSQAYNKLENEFDQKITPAVAGVIALPAGPQRAQALQQAAKNPAQRASLEWAIQNGVLK
jgi:hypothetical protein